jgi:UDP-3-O-[3-hydroxymyristoyl] glucosamine N-acyltransferase
MSVEERRFTVAELAERLGGKLLGPEGVVIRGVAAIDDAGPDRITFITDARYARGWNRSEAGAAIVSQDLELDDDGSRGGRPVIVVADAEQAMIAVLGLFAPLETPPDVGIHPHAWVHETAEIGECVRIGPHVSVDRDAFLGDGVVLYPGVRIYAGVRVDSGSVLHANVVVRQRCTIGRQVILHQGVAIGGEGFGYRPDPSGSGLVRVPHIGTVVIEDGVEIGSNACVDRAKFGATVIGAGTKIDNLVHIAHNVRIGRCCLIAGQVGFSGSVTVGDGVVMAGQVGIADHICIGDRVVLGAQSGVMNDIPAGETWLGYPASPARDALRQWSAVRKLPELLRRLKRSERDR